MEVVADAGPEVDAAVEPDAAPPGPCEEGGEPTFDEGYDCMLNAFCGFIGRCGPAFVALTVEECRRFPLTLFDTGDVQFHRGLVGEAIDEGTVEYHPEAVAACVATMDELECPFLAEHSFFDFDFTTYCPIFSGTVAAEGTCFTMTECAEPGAICLQLPECEDTDACCPGTCSSVSDTGVECTATLPCKSGDFCVAGFCATGAADAPCINTSQCDRGLFCNVETCQPEAEPGSTCFIDDQCPGAETCITVPGDKNGTCGRSDRPGDMCDEFCFGGNCVQPDPDALGTCFAFGSEEGADCSGGFCSRAFECNPATNQCERRGGIGAACLNGFDDCQPGFFCDREITGAEMGVCAERLPDGEPCTSDSHCQSELCEGDPLACVPYPGCFE